jgi:hypothetical protein
VAQFHDEMKELRRELMTARAELQRGVGDMAIMNDKHVKEHSVAAEQIGRLQQQLAEAGVLQATRSESHEKEIALLRVQLAQSASAASGSADYGSGQQKMLEDQVS